MDEIIKELIEKQIPVFIDVAKVNAIENDVCDVTSLTTEKDFFKCRLNAIETNTDNKLVLKPEVGSTVVIGVFKGTEKAVILKFSKVAELNYVQDSTKFKIDANGFEIEREGLNLQNILKQIAINQNKLNQELQKVVVAIGVTPDVAILNLIKQDNEQRINDLIKVLI